MPISILLIVFLTSVPALLAQKRSVDPRISKAHPSVYITFERQGKIASLSGTGEKEEMIWLRLRNNTRWSIVLDMNGLPSKAYGDARLFHDVLSEGKLIAEDRCHVCSFNELPSGRSLVFIVPREDLAESRAIRVRFRYAWEADSGEVEHFVYFYSSKLSSTRSASGLRTVTGSLFTGVPDEATKRSSREEKGRPGSSEEYQNFEELAQQLISVPQTEIDQPARAKQTFERSYSGTARPTAIGYNTSPKRNVAAAVECST